MDMNNLNIWSIAPAKKCENSDIVHKQKYSERFRTRNID